MNETLSSLETEYGFAALDSNGERLDVGLVAGIFNKVLERRYDWLPAADGGCFLGNGARLYWDAGAHPEYAAPECAGHPKLLVAHVRAGHVIMSRIAREVERHRSVAQVRIWRGNVDYASLTSWGCHESYLTQRPAHVLSPDLVPHLVSRVIYGGPGGWSPRAQGLFSLSPRLEMFDMLESSDTMHARGIINSRDEPHAKAHRRLHLICRDNVTSQLADLLSIGITRLVVALADMGLRPAQGLELEDPVAALHTFCRDPACVATVATTKGPMSAVEIQRAYLEQIDSFAERLPLWGAEMVGLCSSILDKLADDPRLLFGQLDWPTKLMIFERNQPAERSRQLMLDVLLSDLEQPLLTDLNRSTESEVVDAEEIEAAVSHAPEMTRAKVRGDVVKRFSGRGDVCCNWSEVCMRDQRLVLDEPFETRERWRAVRSR
ncbi:MAG: proteasome accessory factor PafA2 family protein [Gammaproteobacteria bacterium]|nr:proteasome accessory factor PafA2 family protein [Gammaproteobacteria bacterium]